MAPSVAVEGFSSNTLRSKGMSCPKLKSNDGAAFGATEGDVLELAIGGDAKLGFASAGVGVLLNDGATEPSFGTENVKLFCLSAMFSL